MCASKEAAGAIALAVEGVEEPAVVLVRDDGVHASSEQVFADLVTVIGLVGQEFVRWRRGVEYDRQHPGVGGMSGREREDKKTPFPIAQGMVLRRSTTARATNRLACPPFFGVSRRAVRLDVGRTAAILPSPRTGAGAWSEVVPFYAFRACQSAQKWGP